MSDKQFIGFITASCGILGAKMSSMNFSDASHVLMGITIGAMIGATIGKLSTIGCLNNNQYGNSYERDNEHSLLLEEAGKQKYTRSFRMDIENTHSHSHSKRDEKSALFLDPEYSKQNNSICL